MERLTFDGNFCDIAQCTSTPGGSFCEDGSCSARKVWERLKAYEETGLTPEEIDMDHEAAETLRHLCQNCDLDRLEALAEADKDGRVVVLPVKPVFTPILLYIIEDGDIYEDALYEAVVGMSGNGEMNVVYTTLSDQIIFEQADIGKTVFFTREEAEKALEGMKDGN